MLTELFALMVMHSFLEAIENANLSMNDNYPEVCTRFSPSMKMCHIKSGAGAV